VIHALPGAWTVAAFVETNEDGVVWFTLLGPTPHSMQWFDADGVSHRSLIGCEAIKVGVSTNGNTEARSGYTWLKGLNTPILCRNGRICVYAFASSSVVDEERFKRIVGRATETFGETEAVSWTSWPDDIRKVLTGPEDKEGRARHPTTPGDGVPAAH